MNVQTTTVTMSMYDYQQMQKDLDRLRRFDIRRCTFVEIEGDDPKVLDAKRTLVVSAKQVIDVLSSEGYNQHIRVESGVYDHGNKED